MDFILRTAKRKLPLHENSFVKATAPFLLFAEIKTILQRIVAVWQESNTAYICIGINRNLPKTLLNE